MSVLGSYDETAGRYIGLYKLLQHFESSPLTEAGKCLNNPISFITSLVAKTFANSLFASCIKDRWGYQKIHNTIVHHIPEKERGIALIKSAQISLDSIEKLLTYLARKDPTLIADSVRLIAHDLNLTLDDAKNVIHAWGTFNLLLKDIEKIAKEELLEPLNVQASAQSQQIEEGYQSSRLNYASLESIRGTTWLGMTKVLATNSLTTTVNSAKAVGNGYLYSKKSIQQGTVHVVPLCADQALKLVSSSVEAKIQDLENNLKGRVVTGCMDFGAKKAMTIFIKTSIELYIVSYIMASLRSKDEEDSTLKGYALMYVPLLFTLCYYVYSVRVWRADRLNTQKAVTQVKEEWTDQLSVKLLTRLSGSLKTLLENRGIPESNWGKFQTRCLDTIKTHFHSFGP